jgi:small-conductance mechanosensitive channel
MSNNKDGIKDGLLRGLKRILFTTTDSEDVVPASVSPLASTAAPATSLPTNTIAPASENVKEMKLRIYQLLESLNKPGCDFFEVWNAAIEMGGANSNNIKAAFTSLRYVDKSLTKEKLLETSDFYISSLKKVLDTETDKRQEEKDKLLKQKEQEKANLTAEISDIEQQIIALQNKLADKKLQSEGINGKYKLPVELIEEKINNGHQSVNSIISEMQQVVAIIQKEIN